MLRPGTRRHSRRDTIFQHAFVSTTAAPGLSICQSVHLPNAPLVRTSVTLPVRCPSVHPSSRASLRLSICRPVYLSIYPSVRLSVRPSVRPFVGPSLRMPIYPPIRPSARPSIAVCLSARQSFPPVHLSIHLPIVLASHSVRFQSLDFRARCCRLPHCLSMQKGLLRPSAPISAMVQKISEAVRKPSGCYIGLHHRYWHPCNWGLKAWTEEGSLQQRDFARRMAKPLLKAICKHG